MIRPQKEVTCDNYLLGDRSKREQQSEQPRLRMGSFAPLQSLPLYSCHMLLLRIESTWFRSMSQWL